MVEVYDKVKVFNGFLYRCKYISSVLGSLESKFSVFIPKSSKQVPVLFWLSGLTCTDENFATKAGAFSYAAQHEVALVMPDTSPRGANIAGEDDSWDFGTGAGFYLNATAEPWNKNYNMLSYITEELPSTVSSQFGSELDISRVSISGHSMGGHGALTIALKNPTKYKSVSAFSPIVNPVNCAWGVKAFSNYLGTDDKSTWAEYDACELIKSKGKKAVLPLLVDQGTGDKFLVDQLKTENLVQALSEAGVDADKCQIRMQDGYDHSYYFISTFIGDHIAFHAKHLYA